MKKIEKSISIIEGVFNIDPFFVCQYFFIYPRFMIFDNSHAQRLVNNFLNNSYMGDNFEKLILNTCIRTKFLNGILETVIYDNKCGTPAEERLRKHSGKIVVPEEAGCWCCLYRVQNQCRLWKFDIRDERFSCEEWEEREDDA